MNTDIIKNATTIVDGESPAVGVLADLGPPIPSDTMAVAYFIQFSNTTDSEQTVSELAILRNGAQTPTGKFFNVTVPANSSYSISDQWFPMAAGDRWQAYQDTAGAILITITGWEVALF